MDDYETFLYLSKGGVLLQRRYDVICVGQLCADILVRPVNEKIFTVDSTPVDSMLLWPGGDAQNESCVMAKLGRKPPWWAKSAAIFGGTPS